MQNSLKRRVVIRNVGRIFVIVSVIAMTWLGAKQKYVFIKPTARTVTVGIRSEQGRDAALASNTELLEDIPKEIRSFVGARRGYEVRESRDLEVQVVGETQKEYVIQICPKGAWRITYYLTFDKPDKKTAKVKLPLSAAGSPVGLFLVKANDGKLWGIPSAGLSILGHSPQNIVAHLNLISYLGKDPFYLTSLFYSGGLATAERIPNVGGYMPGAPGLYEEDVKKIQPRIDKVDEKLSEFTFNFMLADIGGQGSDGASSGEGDSNREITIEIEDTKPGNYIALTYPDPEEFVGDLITTVATLDLLYSNLSMPSQYLEGPGLKSRIKVKNEDCMGCDISVDKSSNIDDNFLKLLAIAFVFDISGQKPNDALVGLYQKYGYQYDEDTFGLVPKQTVSEQELLSGSPPEGTYISIGADVGCSGDVLTAFKECFKGNANCKLKDVTEINLKDLKNPANVGFRVGVSVKLGIPILASVRLGTPQSVVAKGLDHEMLNRVYSDILRSPIIADMFKRYTGIEWLYLMGRADIPEEAQDELLPNLIADYNKRLSDSLSASLSFEDFIMEKRKLVLREVAYIAPVIFTGVAPIKLYSRAPSDFSNWVPATLGPYNLRYYIFASANIESQLKWAAANTIPGLSKTCGWGITEGSSYVVPGLAGAFLKGMQQLWAFEKADVVLEVKKEGERYIGTLSTRLDWNNSPYKLPDDITPEILSKCYQQMSKFFKFDSLN